MAETGEVENYAFYSVGRDGDVAGGTGCYAGDAAVKETADKGEGEAHFAHEVDGDLLAFASCEDGLEILVGEDLNGGFVGIGRDLRKGNVDAGAKRLGCEALGFVPGGIGMIGEINQHCRWIGLQNYY